MFVNYNSEIYYNKYNFAVQIVDVKMFHVHFTVLYLIVIEKFKRQN